MRPKGEAERRKYFRIIDEIDVSYRIADAVEDDPEAVVITQGFESINTDIKASLDDLAQTQPQCAASLVLLNKKLDMMIAVAELESTQAQFSAYQLDEVSISACGIAFPAGEQLANDTLLDLSLYLHASEQRVAIRGQVVGCHPLESSDVKKFCLRVEFVDVDELTREDLIQYILQRQRYLLKNLSEELYQGLSGS